MEVLDILKKLDFTEYEAKAYLALLTSSPATGYAVAKNSGVPRSKIYEVLDNMTNRGDIIASPGNPPMYMAFPAKELIAIRKAKAEENFILAEKSLEQFSNADKEAQNIWNISGYDAIIQKVKECIKLATKRILIEVWQEDYCNLEEELGKAAERGVKISIIAYGDINSDFAEVYLHDMSEKITVEYGGRWLVFSADDMQVVAGAVSQGAESRAAWTMHQGLVMPITEVMIHDLYIAEILKAHRDILEGTFGKNLEELRKKFAIHPDFKKHYIE